MPGCHVKPEQIHSLIFGYSDVYFEAASVGGTGGVDRAYGAVVPTGEVWVATLATAYHNDPANRLTVVGVYDGVSYASLDIRPALVAYTGLQLSGWVVMDAGKRLYGQFNSLAVGKTGYLSASGFKMVLTQ